MANLEWKRLNGVITTNHYYSFDCQCLSLVHLPWLTMHFEDYSDVTVAAASACKQLEVCSLERCNLSVKKSLVVKGKKKR